MKFITDDDAKLFLIEINRITEASEATKTFSPTYEMTEELVRKRNGLIGSLKDHRKGQNTKAQWRDSRHNMMRGIKAYHRSTEGKRFHRNLGNFLASRITDSKERFIECVSGKFLYETLKALSSAKTHLYIELEYYHQIFEQSELEEFVLNHASGSIKAIEEKVIGSSELDENETYFLADLIEPSTLTESLLAKEYLDEKVRDIVHETVKNIQEKGFSYEHDDYNVELVSGIISTLNLTRTKLA